MVGKITNAFIIRPELLSLFQMAAANVYLEAVTLNKN
jgi:hypothetical protein